MLAIMALLLGGGVVETGRRLSARFIRLGDNSKTDAEFGCPMSERDRNAIHELSQSVYELTATVQTLSDNVARQAELTAESVYILRDVKQHIDNVRDSVLAIKRKVG